MPRQYTFRTTRETSWLDSVLEAIPIKDRARFIRDCIMRGLNGSSVGFRNVTQSEHVTQKEDKPNTKVTQIEHDTGIKAEPYGTFDIENEPVIETIEEDLDSKLDNLFD